MLSKAMLKPANNTMLYKAEVANLKKNILLICQKGISACGEKNAENETSRWKANPKISKTKMSAGYTSG